MSIRQIRKSLLAVAGAVVLAAGGLFAGRLSAGAVPQEARRDFAPRVYARIARALDLSEGQKSEIKTVLRSHAAEIKAQMQAAASARRALHNAVMAQPLDEAAIRARAQELGRVNADGAVLFARLRAEIEPILTEEQRGKIQRFHDRMQSRTESAVKSLDAFLQSCS